MLRLKHLVKINKKNLISLIRSLVSVLFSFLEMDLFKTDILQKEFNEFVNKTLPKIKECNYCNINCCKNHYRFDVTCKNCRSEKCRNCQFFNQQMDSLMKGADNHARQYLYNFVSDFFCISKETLKFFFNIDNNAEFNENNIIDFKWKLRMFHGNQYKLEGLSKTLKYTYTIRKRRFVYIRKYSHF